MNTRAGKVIVIVFFGVAFFSEIIILTWKWNSTIAELAEQYCKSTGLAVLSVKLDFICPNLIFPIQNSSLISIDFECWKDRSLIKQLVHELMTFKMLMELYTSISTLAQKLVLTPLNNKYVLKILESIFLTLKICKYFLIKKQKSYFWVPLRGFDLTIRSSIF